MALDDLQHSLSVMIGLGLGLVEQRDICHASIYLDEYTYQEVWVSKLVLEF